MILSRNMKKKKNIRIFYLKIFIFFYLCVVKFSICLKRRVFIMWLLWLWNHQMIQRTTKPTIRSVWPENAQIIQGPVVQSIVNLTSSLEAKILTFLVSTISNSQVFLLKKKNANAKATHIFSANMLAYTCYPYLIDTLANDIAIFE